MLPGKYFMPYDFGGVYQDLYVRVLILNNGEDQLAVITYDAADMGRTADISKALVDAYGFSPTEILFAATHSHEAPLFYDQHEALANDPGKKAWVVKYGDFVLAQTVKAVGQALETLRPARYGFNTGNSYINVCRDQLFEDGTWGHGVNFEGPSDKTLAILQVVDTEGKIIAALLNYAVHGTVCFKKMDPEEKNYLISGDIPGMMSAYLEERYKQDRSVFLWTSGAAANQNPIVTGILLKFNHDKSHEEGFDLGYSAWSLCENLAEVHALDAIRIINATNQWKEQFQLTIAERTIPLPGQRVVQTGNENGMLIPGSRSMDIRILDADPVDLKLKLIIFDDIAFLSMNAELVCEIGLRLKEKFPIKNLVIITHAGERIGYLPDKWGYEHRTFAFYTSRVKDGCTEEFLTPTVLEMFEARLKS